VSALSLHFFLLLSHKKVNTKHVENIKRPNRPDPDHDDERVRDESGGEEEEEWRRALLRVQSGVRAV
jgi:hypothetical protein